MMQELPKSYIEYPELAGRKTISGLFFLFLKLVNSTKVFQLLLQANKYGTSLPQSPDISGTEVFNTDIVKQKHESLWEQGKGKPESKARGQGIGLRSPL